MSNIDDELDSIDLHNNDTPPSFDDDDGGLDELDALAEQAANAEQAEVPKTTPSNDDVIKPTETPKTAPSDIKNNNVNEISKARFIVNDVFVHTGIKITEDDPLVLMMLHNSSLLQSTQAELTDAIKAINTEMLQAIQTKHEDGLTAFNERIAYVEKLLAKLEGQKDAIIQDVWSKSQDIMYERTKTTMQKAINEMMQEGQGAVNNQRNILMGAVVGIIFGMVLAAAIISFT